MVMDSDVGMAAEANGVVVASILIPQQCLALWIFITIRRMPFITILDNRTSKHM